MVFFAPGLCKLCFSNAAFSFQLHMVISRLGEEGVSLVRNLSALGAFHQAMSRYARKGIATLFLYAQSLGGVGRRGSRDIILTLNISSCPARDKRKPSRTKVSETTKHKETLEVFIG